MLVMASKLATPRHRPTFLRPAYRRWMLSKASRITSPWLCCTTYPTVQFSFSISLILSSLPPADALLSPTEGFARPADVYTEPAVFRINIDVQYGNLDLFNLTRLCGDYKCSGGDKSGAPCSGRADRSTCVGGGVCLYTTCTPCRPCNVTDPPLDYLRFTHRKSLTGTVLAGKHSLQAEGPFKAILALLVNLRYAALPDQNTMRLRSKTLSPSSFATQPYETATYTISQRQPMGAFIPVGNVTVLIRIAAVNNFPVLVNPQKRYTLPTSCGVASGFDLRAVPLACFFGPYWVREDATDVLQITDFDVTDVDLTEEDLAARLDTKIFAYRGIVDLNTRTDLSFYGEAARPPTRPPARSPAARFPWGERRRVLPPSPSQAGVPACAIGSTAWIACRTIRGTGQGRSKGDKGGAGGDGGGLHRPCYTDDAMQSRQPQINCVQVVRVRGEGSEDARPHSGSVLAPCQWSPANRPCAVGYASRRPAAAWGAQTRTRGIGGGSWRRSWRPTTRSRCSSTAWRRPRTWGRRAPRTTTTRRTEATSSTLPSR
jgi:hypothetical protein